jgi:hypothetical protein
MPNHAQTATTFRPPCPIEAGSVAESRGDGGQCSSSGCLTGRSTVDKSWKGGEFP